MWLQLSNHCQEYGLLPDYQSAYRPNYSCETNLLKISNDILWNFECQHITSLTVMDLSAAFDTVDHDVFLQILNNKFGVTDTALNWFRSYLQPRQFKVKVGEAYSSERSLTYSVPQGSCAGANIFNLYCSPLGDTIPASLSLSGFADDHSIRTQFHVSNRIEEIQCKDQIKKAMITTKNWMDSMRLKMNLAKMEFIYFGHHLQLRKCSEEQINVAGDEIRRSTCIKYLGAYLNEGLTFKRHVAAKCKAAMGNLLKIRSIRHLLDKSTAINLHLSLCISHLDYANSLLYGLPQVTIQRMQCIQNICARLILRKTNRDSIMDCMKTLHWLPIEYRIKFKILTLTFKCLRGEGPHYLCDLLVENKPSRQGLRSQKLSCLLVIPRTKYKTFASRVFSTSAPTLWNSLPDNLRLIDSFLMFKSQLKTYLFKQAYDI